MNFQSIRSLAKPFFFWSVLIAVGIEVFLHYTICDLPYKFLNHTTGPVHKLGQYSKKAYFLVDDERLNSIYSQFSAKIKVLNHQDLNDFNSFILISLKNDLPKLNPSTFEITSLGKFHERLPLFCTKFEKMESSQTTPPS